MAEYTYYIVSDYESKQVYPFNNRDFSFIKEKETDSYFYRTKVNGDILLSNNDLSDDFTYMYTIESRLNNNVSRDQLFQLKVYKDNVLKYTFQFLMTDCDFDEYRNTVSLTNLDPVDTYSELLAVKDAEVNIINAAKNTVILPVKSELVFFCDLKATTENYRDESYSNYGTIRFFFVRSIDIGLTVFGNDVYINVYASEVLRVPTGAVLSKDDEPNFNDGTYWGTFSDSQENNYTTYFRNWSYSDINLVTADIKAPPFQSISDYSDYLYISTVALYLPPVDAKYNIYIAKEDYPGYLFNVTAEKELSSLNTVIDYILSENGIALTFYSDFLNTSARNPVTNVNPNPYRFLHVAAESDINKPFADQQDTEVLISFDKIMTAISILFNGYWVIESSNVVFYHVDNLEYDTTTSLVDNYEKYIRYKNKYSYETSDIVNQETFYFRTEGKIEGFKNKSIVYPNTPLVDGYEKNIKENRCELMTDITKIQELDYQAGSNDIVLLSCNETATAGTYEVRRENLASGDLIPNALLSWERILPQLHVYRKPHDSGIINGNTYQLRNKLRTKLQEELIIFEPETDIEPEQFFQTFAGIGEVKTIEEIVNGWWKIQLLLKDSSIAIWSDEQDRAVVDEEGNLIKV